MQNSLIQLEKLGLKPQSDKQFLSIAYLHKKVIHGGSLAQWSEKALARLYEFIAGHEASFVIAAKNESGELVGFIAGTESVARLFSDFLRKSFLRNFFIFIPSLFSWDRLKRAVETLIYPKSRSAHIQIAEPEILNFCVDQSKQRAGVGKLLFKALITEFRSRGVTKIGIVTGVDQISAQHFYERQGAIKVGELSIHSGKVSIAYEYLLQAGE